jgi:hypothetical protein
MPGSHKGSGGGGSSHKRLPEEIDLGNNNTDLSDDNIDKLTASQDSNGVSTKEQSQVISPKSELISDQA